MTRILRPISLCILLLSVFVSAAPAQQKQPALQTHAWVAPVLVPDPRLPITGIAGGTREGAIWSGVGVTAGMLGGFLVGGLLAQKYCLSYWSSEWECATAVGVPFGIGAGVGAALGAETGGDRRAWRTTTAGAAIGTAATMIMAVHADYWAPGLLVLPPAVGAWIGNRLGQPR